MQKRTDFPANLASPHYFILKEKPFFTPMNPEEQERVSASLITVHLKRGDAAFRCGSEPKGLYFVKEGSIKSVIRTRNGEELTSAVFAKHDFFGISALMDGLRYDYDAVALKPCRLFLLRKADFVKLLGNSPDIIHLIINSLSSRMRKKNRQLKDICFSTVSRRVAKKLAELAGEYGRKNDQTVTIDLGLTQSDLAGLLGTTRESVNKALGAYQKKGVLAMRERTIFIYDLDAVNHKAGLK